MEKAVIFLGFTLTGLTFGFFTFLLLRMGLHQNKFEWRGSLSVITTLVGGGFLTYSSDPLNFAAYGIGYFIGVLCYILYLWLQSIGRVSLHMSFPDRRAIPINTDRTP